MKINLQYFGGRGGSSGKSGSSGGIVGANGDHFKALKVYGTREDASVYIDGKKVSVYEVPNSIYVNNKSDYGYTQTNYLMINVKSSDRKFIDGSRITPNEIKPTRVSYSLYKELQKLGGSGYIQTSDYD